MRIDQKALDTASEIMQLLDQPMPYGQLKARIQCLIIESLREQIPYSNLQGYQPIGLDNKNSTPPKGR